MEFLYFLSSVCHTTCVVLRIFTNAAMKKFFALTIFLAFAISATQVKAFILIPFLNITINKTSIGGNGSFGFHVVGRNNGVPYFNQDASISTQSGAGSAFVGMVTGGGDMYTVTEDVAPGWVLTSASCSSSNSSISFTPTANGVNIIVQPYSSITCNFTNTQQLNKTPILIVPGLFGTDILKGNALLWSDIQRMVNPLNDDDFMDPLQFKSDLNPLDTSLVLGGVIKKKTQIVGLREVTLYDYTDGLINLLTSADFGYVEGQDLFTFPYDWRKGVSEETVNQLKGQIDYIINQTVAGQAAGRVDVVAHSTGGLVTKKYVIEHPADHHIGKAVFVGVPNLGAPKAYKALIQGDNFDIPGLEGLEMKKIAQNMPVAYDLAPTKEYVNQVGSFLRSVDIFPLSGGGYARVDHDAGYAEATGEFKAQHLINDQALANSESLHTTAFDTFDLRTAGINLYNLVGCKSGTFGQFSELVGHGGEASLFDFPRFATGDGTVPFGSVDSLPVDANHTFFYVEAEHGKMMSSSGGRQAIVNMLTGSSLDTGGSILTHDDVQQHPDKCELDGETIKVKSPVAISVTDQDGNVLGLAEDGSLQNDIPGADMEVWGEHKYLFLPSGNGRTYQIHLKGTGVGTFALDDETVVHGVTTHTQVFNNIPVTPALSGEVNLGGVTTLTLDTNSDGVIDQTLQPTAVLDATQATDELAPVTTVTVTGTQGSAGYYRSNVSVSLAATDYAQSGVSPAGVFETKSRVDSGQWIVNSSPIQITTEGQHTLQFYSTDNAGNAEAVQTVQFTIDKTAPEALFTFSPQTKDLDISPVDAIDSAPTVVQNGILVTLKDKAGNSTALTFKERDRRASLSARLVGLSYNGVAQDISKTLFQFAWTVDRQQKLKTLLQQVTARNNFTIYALYGGGDTTLVGRDSTGAFAQRLPGLKLLQVKTNKGDFAWQVGS